MSDEKKKFSPQPFGEENPEEREPTFEELETARVLREVADERQAERALKLKAGDK